MDAMLMDVKRFAVHDGPGIRTTLFLKGCSLKCIWCHNPEGIGAKPQMAYYEHKCIGCGECVSVCAQGAQKIMIRQLAEWMDVIDYEAMLAPSRRVPRVYMKQGD